MNFACYRLPYADSYTRIESDQSPVTITDFSTIGLSDGFVVAPFSGPAVVIPNDRIISLPVPAEDVKTILLPSSAPSLEYEQTFKKFHSEILSHNAEKLVLARKQSVPTTADPLKVFHRACIKYPRLMIMLFHTEITGTWIVASPEILLESIGGTSHHTVALAGTMPFSEGYGEWNAKNRGEQHLVESYIESKLSAICHDIVKDGPVTMRAGHLQHLRTDFRFKGSSIGEIVAQLHPTPAILGFPSYQAREIIFKDENLDRRYYSGFAGPVSTTNNTHLYVSIRCAEFFEDHADLYAGGGIMPESDCHEEWTETQRKMDTIFTLLY